MPDAAFFDYVRGRTDAVPDGYREDGLRAYRHLVWLGASQMIDAEFPAVRPALGEDGWHELIAAFVRESAWESHFYEDLTDAFPAFLARAQQS